MPTYTIKDFGLKKTDDGYQSQGGTISERAVPTPVPPSVLPHLDKEKKKEMLETFAQAKAAGVVAWFNPIIEVEELIAKPTEDDPQGKRGFSYWLDLAASDHRQKEFATKMRLPDNARPGPDTMTIRITPAPGTANAFTGPQENPTWQTEVNSQSFSFPTTFFAHGEMLAFDALGKCHAFGLGEDALHFIRLRNEYFGLIQSPRLEDWMREHTAKPKALDIAAPVVQAIVATPNWPGDRRFAYAMTQIDRKDAWRTNEQEGFKYLPGSPHKADVPDVIFQPNEIYPGEDWWSTQRKATLEALDRRFARIRGDAAADTADILFHHWSKTKKENSSRTAVEYAAITLATICEYRGISDNKNNIELAYDALRDVRAFRLGGPGSAALFTIEEPPGQLRLWEQDESPVASTIFVYAPGFFLAKAIEGDPFFIAPFMSRVWQLNPHYDSHAKRLARYLRGEWRMNLPTYLKDTNRLDRFRTWEQVLTDAGIGFDGYEAKKEPKRYTASIHEAVETLRREGIIEGKQGTRDDGWIYHPEDLSKLEALDSKRGVLKRWLTLRVRIDPPSELRPKLAKTYTNRLAWDKAQMQAQSQVKAKALAKAKKGKSK